MKFNIKEKSRLARAKLRTIMWEGNLRGKQTTGLALAICFVKGMNK